MRISLILLAASGFVAAVPQGYSNGGSLQNSPTRPGRFPQREINQQQHQQNVHQQTHQQSKHQQSHQQSHQQTQHQQTQHQQTQHQQTQHQQNQHQQTQHQQNQHQQQLGGSSNLNKFGDSSFSSGNAGSGQGFSGGRQDQSFIGGNNARGSFLKGGVTSGVNQIQQSRFDSGERDDIFDSRESQFDSRESFSQGFNGGSVFGGSSVFSGNQDSFEAPRSCAEGEVLNLDGTCVTPIVNRKIYVYAAPPQKLISGPPRPLPKPKINYNIVFVRTPEFLGGAKPLVVPPPQQKTLVYVLSKQPNALEQEVIEVPSVPSQPEVFFVNYGQGDNPQLPGGIDLREALSQSVQQGQIIDGGGQDQGGFGGQFEGNSFVEDDLQFKDVNNNKNNNNIGGSFGGFSQTSSSSDFSHESNEQFNNDFSSSAVFVGNKGGVSGFSGGNNSGQFQPQNPVQAPPATYSSP